MLKEIFLKALKEGWKHELKKMKEKPTKEQLVAGSMHMLQTFGDTLITKEDIEKAAEEVFKECEK